MAHHPIEAEIDRLYRLPPEAFTAARNALAKTAGADGAAVKRLAKPSLAAWAVNQVYWEAREIYDALVDAAGEMRQAHKAVLSGRSADIRAAGRTHEAAADAALKAALGVVRAAGHPVTDATRQAIATTLRTLPGNEHPGRLTVSLQPGGFEMLSGLSVSPAASHARHEDAGGRAHAATSGKASAVNRKRAARADGTAKAAAHARGAEAHAAHARDVERKPAHARTAERKAATAAARALRDAEHDARRGEFEAARAARDAERSARRAQEAREALDTAQGELEAAQAATAAAQRAFDAAEAAATEAQRARVSAEARAAAARKAAEAARAAVKRA